jgi:outer membrane protein OmpU
VIGFSGFSVGGSIAHDNTGTANDGDNLTWDVGVTYSTGPWTVGVTYMQVDQEVTSTRDDEMEGFHVSGTYNLGPGVDLWAGVKYMDYQSDTNLAANENEALFGMIGTSVSF